MDPNLSCAQSAHHLQLYPAAGNPAGIMNGMNMNLNPHSMFQIQTIRCENEALKLQLESTRNENNHLKEHMKALEMKNQQLTQMVEINEKASREYEEFKEQYKIHHEHQQRTMMELKLQIQELAKAKEKTEKAFEMIIKDVGKYDSLTEKFEQNNNLTDRRITELLMEQKKDKEKIKQMEKLQIELRNELENQNNHSMEVQQKNRSLHEQIQIMTDATGINLNDNISQILNYSELLKKF